MSSAYDRVRGSKLILKGSSGIEKKISKKVKKKKAQQPDADLHKNEEAETVDNAGADPSKSAEKPFEIDTGTGHAPDGKKSKKYEELFPVETRRRGYVVPTVDSREAALDDRIKKKADRYCK